MRPKYLSPECMDLIRQNFPQACHSWIKDDQLVDQITRSLLVAGIEDSDFFIFEYTQAVDGVAMQSLFLKTSLGFDRVCCDDTVRLKPMPSITYSSDRFVNRGKRGDKTDVVFQLDSGQILIGDSYDTQSVSHFRARPRKYIR